MDSDSSIQTHWPLAWMEGFAYPISMARSGQSKLWTEDETILALYLYFQLPFGKLDQRTPEVRQLAAALGRTNSSIAMKLVNFASLDPKIARSGRKGLSGATNLDRSVYEKFGKDWNSLVEVANKLWRIHVDADLTYLDVKCLKENEKVSDTLLEFKGFLGESERHGFVSQRIGQGFFRRAVLANYDEVCCVTGLAEPKLLVASHIIPWKNDIANRHNPANGLLLSATIDKAFDSGLITITPDGRIRVSQRLLGSNSSETSRFFKSFDNAEIRASRRFDPDATFLVWHNENRFIDEVA